MQRLFVRKIVSIGACEAGDNEPAKVLLMKRRQTARGRTAQGPESGTSFSGSGPATGDYSDVWKILGEIKAMRAEGQTMKKHDTGENLAKEITDVVHARAEAMATHPDFWDRTDLELRAEVWRKHRELRDLCTAASRSDGQEIAKSGEFADAFKTFRTWRDDPNAGLR